MKDIDIKIEKALKDSNITKIMNKSSQRFRNQLDSDDIYTCQINALWKCFLNFKPEKNVKFTTYLFNGVFIECLKQIKFNNKHEKFNKSKLHKNISRNKDENMLLEILDEAKDEEEKSLIIDKYNNMTIKEMAEKRKSNRETVRKKLKNVLNRIKKNIQEVY